MPSLRKREGAACLQRNRRSVRRVPSGVIDLDITSQERTWEAHSDELVLDYRLGICASLQQLEYSMDG